MKSRRWVDAAMWKKAAAIFQTQSLRLLGPGADLPAGSLWKFCFLERWSLFALEIELKFFWFLMNKVGRGEHKIVIKC
jgi:hypothetical protein